MAKPGVLLLDEPTNHLDLGAMEWLERTLGELEASVLMVSHDRWFLESAATGVLELEDGRAKVWPMRYSAFRRAKAEAIGHQAQQAERQAAEIARLERFVARWSAGTKARQATSRKRQLARIERIQRAERQALAGLRLPPGEASGRLVVEADGLTWPSRGGSWCRGADFAVERGWRVAVVGPNGAGKTTLIETLLGLRPPARGRASLGHKVRPGYFTQHAHELREDRTVLETALSGNDLTQTQVRTLLGRFLFPGDAVERRVEKLSGGERRRLALVGLLAGAPNLLVLDEPTNHMDTESREALEDALAAYDGTVILVSHDRALIDAAATHTLALEDGRAVLRAGGWADLVRAREEAAAPPPPPRRGPARARRRRAPRGPVLRGPTASSAGWRSGSRALEAELAEVQAALADPAALADRDAVAERGARHRGHPGGAGLAHGRVGAGRRGGHGGARPLRPAGPSRPSAPGRRRAARGTRRSSGSAPGRWPAAPARSPRPTPAPGRWPGRPAGRRRP